MTLYNVLLDFTKNEVSYDCSIIDKGFIDSVLRIDKRINFYLAINGIPQYLQEYYKNSSLDLKVLEEFAEQYLVPFDQIIYIGSEGLERTILEHSTLNLIITGGYQERKPFYRNIYGKKIKVFAPMFDLNLIKNEIKSSLIYNNELDNMNFV